MNIFENSIKKALDTLKNGGIILYPTDTIWGLGADATNSDAVKRIFQIKQRAETKSFIILVDSVEMLQQYVKISENVLQFIALQKKPTTIIYDEVIGLSHSVLAQDGSVAIRVVEDDFCKKLIKEFSRPIVSTSANLSGEKTPFNFLQISSEIKQKVDYIVEYQQDNLEERASSQIVKFSKEGELIIIRS